MPPARSLGGYGAFCDTSDPFNRAVPGEGRDPGRHLGLPESPAGLKHCGFESDSGSRATRNKCSDSTPRGPWSCLVLPDRQA